MTTAAQSTEPSFDWPLAYQAESLVRDFIAAFQTKNSAAKSLANDMSEKTGTDFLEWVDHFTLTPDHESELQDAGFVNEAVQAGADDRRRLPFASLECRHLLRHPPHRGDH